MMKSILTLLLMGMSSLALAAPAAYLVQQADNEMTVDGDLSEWSATYLLGTITGDENVFARNAAAPFDPAVDWNGELYAAWQDEKIHFAVKVTVDDDNQSGRVRNWSNDNLKINPGGHASAFYLWNAPLSAPDNPYSKRSSPFNFGSTMEAAVNTSGNGSLPVYEFSLRIVDLDPFGSNEFKLSIGSEEADGGSDNDSTYLGFGVEYKGPKTFTNNSWDATNNYPTFRLAGRKHGGKNMAEVVANMKVGEFAALTAPGLTDDMLHTGPVKDVVMAFQNEAIWDPLTRQILFIGGPHRASQRFNVFDVKANRWRSEPLFPGNPTSHSYDNMAIDAKGNMYYQHFRKKIDIFNTLENKWESTLPGSGQRYGSLELFPEMDALIYIYHGTIQKMPLSIKSWSTLKSGIPMSNLHNLADYNPIHKVIFFGGGDGSKHFYRLDAEGNVSTMASCPIVFRTHGALMTTDPVTGDVLVTDSQHVYAYRVAQDQWEKAAKSFVEKPSRTVVIPISGYGVIAYFSDSRFPLLLYKHAE